MSLDATTDNSLISAAGGAVGTRNSTRSEHVYQTIWRRWSDSVYGEVALLVLFTLLAAALRFLWLGQWSFWIDELYSVERAEAFARNADAVARWPPPSVMLMAAALRQFGVSEWSARLVPALIGILTIPALYLPARLLAGRGAALLAAFLLALSPWHLFWSQNARFYPMLMLLCALSAMAFFLGMERDRLSLLAMSSGLFLIAFRERYLALLLVPVALTYLLLVYVLRFERPRGFRTRTLGFLLILGTALLSYDMSQLLVGGGSRVLSGWQLEYPEPVGNPIRLAMSIMFEIGIPVTVLALAGGLWSLLQRDRAGSFLLLWAVVPVVALLAANPFYFTDPRYALITLPAWILLAAVAVRRLVQSTRGHRAVLAAGVAALLVTDAAAADLLYYRAYRGNRLDWKGAFTVARERSQGGDAFVAWWPEFGRYYVGHPVIPWPGLEPRHVLAQGRRHWFILDSERVWTNLTMKTWVEQNAELVDVRYLRTPREAWLRVYLYDPTRGGLQPGP